MKGLGGQGQGEKNSALSRRDDFVGSTVCRNGEGERKSLCPSCGLKGPGTVVLDTTMALSLGSGVVGGRGWRKREWCTDVCSRNRTPSKVYGELSGRG